MVHSNNLRMWQRAVGEGTPAFSVAKNGLLWRNRSGMLKMQGVIHRVAGSGVAGSRGAGSQGAMYDTKGVADLPEDVAAGHG